MPWSSALRPALEPTWYAAAGLALALVASTAHAQEPPLVETGSVEVKTRVAPVYPAAGKDLGLDPVRCLALVTIGEDGVPYEITVDGCPEPFVAPTIEALLQWRWYPPTVNGEVVKARISIGVNYRLDDPDTGPAFIDASFSVGWEHAPRDGSGIGAAPNRLGWRLRVGMGSGLAVGMDTDQRIATRMTGSGALLLGGCPLRPAPVVPALLTGFGYAAHRDLATDDPAVLDLYVPTRRPSPRPAGRSGPSWGHGPGGRSTRTPRHTPLR